MHKCLVCSAGLVKKSGPGRWPQFCSPNCRRVGENQRERARRASPGYVPSTSDYRERPGCRSVICESCGGRARNGNQRGKTRFCSKPDCVRAGKRIRKREQYVPASTTAPCELCGTVFTARCKTRFCSPRCRSREWAIRYRASGKSADFSARRRALEKGAKVKDGRRAAILLRDGWVCQLCGTLTDDSLGFPHPLYPVIDHVVALARGGVHGPDNWQTAHNLCNILKSDLSVDAFHEKYPNIRERLLAA